MKILCNHLWFVGSLVLSVTLGLAVEQLDQRYPTLFGKYLNDWLGFGVLLLIVSIAFAGWIIALDKEVRRLSSLKHKSILRIFSTILLIIGLIIAGFVSLPGIIPIPLGYIPQFVLGAILIDAVLVFLLWIMNKLSADL